LVENPSGALESLLVEHTQHERVVTRGLVFEFADRFKETHGLKIQFTEAAADALVSMACDQHQPVREFCAAHFKDFQFGLKLIAQNTGQQEFKLDLDAIQAPDKTLSQWVVESYRKEKTEAN
jgi:ATP-dependent Clp protease ATP-binding subunit ClpX